MFEPYYDRDGITIYHGDCLESLRQLPDESVNCCITSPPYWGLRDYGHEGQLGLEKTPEEYVTKMVEVFREVKRVLKKDGTLWLNLGDTYWGGKGQSGAGNPEEQEARKDVSLNKSYHQIAGDGETRPQDGKHAIIKPKDLVGIPWRVAFALQADGWYLRQDIIWHKPNPMPESVTDRCTKAHEYIFLLSKSARYYYNADAIKEPSVDIESYTGRRIRNAGKMDVVDSKNYKFHGSIGDDGKLRYGMVYETSNRRSVWTVTTKPCKEAHFATFPEDLIEPMVKAGCPEKGVILDPFVGSGTSLVVAKKWNRQGIGLELNEKYCEIAVKRIEAIPPNLPFEEEV